MEFMEMLSYLLIRILLPLSIVVAFVFLTILTQQLIELLKSVKVISEDVEYKLDLLKEPVDTIVSINKNYKKFLVTFIGIYTTYRNIFKRNKTKKKKKK